ncbi:MAG: phosphoribosylamine--glycine ligase [Gemmatimonadota bacterium]|nr:MAG: phosphoribosylamine--glycine ligase [Gemmatimonadota bacterium]
MKILVVGGGGREHTICWALSRSATVFCAPGNPGTHNIGTNLPISPSDHDAVVAAIRENQIDLTVIGPEAPLAEGLVDRLVAEGLHVFGPDAKAAQLESSKAFAKDIMVAAGVATAAGEQFTDAKEAIDYIATHPEPLVVKASGLAAGKGAVVCPDRETAKTTAREMLAGKFGSAGDLILVEECLQGEELSVIALTDGEEVMLLPSSQDHKRLGEGDTGPNTGGMGAYAPVSIAGPELLDQALNDVMKPVLAKMAEMGTPYRGILYAGLMIDAKGKPWVLEFNCRIGDPEAQVVLPVLDTDLTDHLWRIASGENWTPDDLRYASSRAAVTTVLASPGYPAAPVKGAAITIPEELPPDSLLFHAGTSLDADGVLRTSGGRVLCATGLGVDVTEALARSQSLAEAVDFEGKVFRRDIAWREVARAGAA